MNKSMYIRYNKIICRIVGMNSGCTNKKYHSFNIYRFIPSGTTLSGVGTVTVYIKDSYEGDSKVIRRLGVGK